jgi:hypothetical protein
VKRLADLTVEDLIGSPVWRYEGGSGSEAQVAPSTRQSLSQLDDEIFLAATEFALADASRHMGFCFPADDSGIDYLQPVIVGRGMHVAFWFDGPVSSEELAVQWSAFGKEPKQIFPVAFRCLVPVDGRTVSGRIQSVESSESMPPEPEPVLPAETETLEARPARRRGVGTGEKRTARRLPAEMTVEFSQGELQGTGIIGDVSRRGMFVQTTRIPGTGPVLRLTVNLPGGRKLVLRGKVVRNADGTTSTPPTGFGLRLVDEWPDYENLFRRRDKPK